MAANPVAAPAARAAIYVRVSSQKQEDNASLLTQEVACRRYAADRGHRVEAVYREVYTGGALWERPQLTALRESVRRGEVEAVICYAIDRLSRDQAHLFILVDEWERAGAALEFATEELDQSPLGKMILSLKGFVAEVEREKIKERTMRGRRARADSGKLIPGPRPLYGYCFRDEHRTGYEIDPRTAPIVREIFALAATGTPTRAIAKRLRDRGIPAPGGGEVWHPMTISDLLRHPAYTGRAEAYRWRYSEHVKSERPPDERIPLPAGVIPPLVDEQTFADVQVRLRRNRELAARNTRDPEAALLRGGYARCGECGRAMRVAHRPSRGRSMELYVCNRDRVAVADRHPAWSIGVRKLDLEVWESLKVKLRDERLVERQLARLREEEDRTVAELVAVEAQLAKLDRLRANLTKRLALFDSDEEAAPVVAEIRQLGKRRSGLATERDRLFGLHERGERMRRNLLGLQEWCRTVAVRLESLTYEQKRLALDGLGVRVRVWGTGHEPRWVLDLDPAFVYATSCSSPTAGASARRPRRAARSAR